MLSALISGQIIRDPKSGVSASGTKWCNTTIRCPTGHDKDGAAEVAFITVAAFGDQADRLARLAKGDAIAAQGSLRPTTYEKNGATRHGLELLAMSILSPYDLRKKRGSDGSDHRHQAADHRPAARQPTREDFDDHISF